MFRCSAAAWLLVFCFAASANAQTMSHSLSPVVEPLMSINCSNANGHADNSYWRSYTLCDFGIDDGITINSVSFGVENSTVGVGLTTQPINVRIYEDPTPGNIGNPATLNLLYGETFQVGTLALQTFVATFATPVTVACHTTIVVEINSPNGQTAGHLFFIGANDNGQTAPSYISAGACTINVPTDTALIGAPNMQMIIDVNYTLGAVCGSCSGIAVDCHVPAQGSYELVFEEADVFTSSPNALISDTLPTTTDSITVAGVPTIDDLDVMVDITHGFVGDLLMTVADPAGTTVTLHANAGVNLADIRAVYDDNGGLNARPFSTPAPNPPVRIMPAGPGTLADYNAGIGDGTWTLSITDGTLDPSVGQLNSWELRFINRVPIPDNTLTPVDTTLSVKSTNVDEIMDLDVRTEISHGMAAQLTVDVTSPAGTSVRLAAQNLTGANVNERFDDAAPTFCDGFGTLVSGPGSMSDFDGEGVGGDWTLSVRDGVAGVTGDIERWFLMINPAPCDSPTGLLCESDCELSDVNLTWTNPPTSTYTSIEIRRDGVVIGSAPGAATAFTDVGVAAGNYQYEVIGDCSPGRASAVCEVEHQVYNGATDVIFALELPDLIDSAAALEAALVGNGLTVLVANSFNFDCVAAPGVERVWVLCGTFPQNYPLTQADGDLLVNWVTSGIAVYIEGGDIWGFDPVTAFEGYDGVENAVFTNLQDGDDSLVQLTGQNSGFGLDFTGTIVSYGQASTGIDSNDRLVPCDINSDLGGTSAGVIWTGMDPTAGPYNVGIYYQSTFSPVISQSFEIGGFGGDIGQLTSDYVGALGGVVGGGFKRGDMNADGSVNLQDPVLVLGFLFNQGAAPICPDSADANDDGSINLQDPVLILNFLFNFGLPPEAPGPNNCGPDVNVDTLDPCNYPTTSPPC